MAACSEAGTVEASSTIEIAVVPREALGSEEVEAARHGKYREAVTCDFSTEES
ncbi:hypothetical protein ACQ3I4_08290 [Zafaria sp. Z1313]|uniref:hypothetical protein n=1 Tax=Zafaria sp. Z1313 TaxID=3423202 RepID=UPI002EAFEECA|nr:hypothetical protein [Zafaria sp. J156]